MSSRSRGRASGNPAKRAEEEKARAEQREQERRRQSTDYEQVVRKRRRTLVAWWSLGALAAAAVVTAVVLSFVLAPQPATYSPGGSGERIEGVETFDNGTTHVEGTVDYPQTPPAGGPHANAWLNCGVYTEPQRNEYAVHSLEHGAVWLTYDPGRVSETDLETLREYVPGDYAILSPYPGMDTPIAVSAWNAQLKVDDASDPRIADFFEEYWRNQNVPEPNAACSNGIDGPGRA